MKNMLRKEYGAAHLPGHRCSWGLLSAPGVSSVHTLGDKTHSSPMEDLAETNRIQNKVKWTLVGWCPWSGHVHLRSTVLYRLSSVFMELPGLFLDGVLFLTLFGWKYPSRAGATPAADKTALYRARPLSAALPACIQAFTKPKVLQFCLSVRVGNRTDKTTPHEIMAGKSAMKFLACLTWPEAANCLLWRCSKTLRR